MGLSWLREATRTLAEIGAHGRLRFGVFSENNGLTITRARQYDRILGRFLSEDPITNEKLFNQYRYGRNNPSLYLDPSGLEDMEFDTCPDCQPYSPYNDLPEYDPNEHTNPDNRSNSSPNPTINNDITDTIADNANKHSESLFQMGLGPFGILRDLLWHMEAIASKSVFIYFISL